MSFSTGHRPSALVVGMGSIGTRHAEVLGDLGVSVHTVSRRAGGDFTTVKHALDSTLAPDYVVIATETVDHQGALTSLDERGFVGEVLVEKPLFADTDAPPAFPSVRSNTHVGYNLRYHPALEDLQTFARSTTVRSLQIHAGQDVRQWRPGRDVAATASALPGSGGVLRDLSHELDYLLWVFGPWKRALGIGGRRSELGIGSDDVWHAVLEMESGTYVSVELNYLDAPARRTISAASEDGSILVDLVAGTVASGEATEAYEVERNHTYRAMHEAILKRLSHPESTDPRLCTFDQGYAVVRLISALEQSNREGQWQTQSQT